MGLTSSQWLPEHEDHVMRVEGAAYKVRYRPGAGKLRNDKACGKYIYLSVELKLITVRRKTTNITKTCYIL
jgi:hypothetical protein